MQKIAVTGCASRFARVLLPLLQADPNISLSIVDQVFFIWYHHPIQETGYYLWRRLSPRRKYQKGGVEMSKSARHATSISSMKVWSCIEDARRT